MLGKSPVNLRSLFYVHDNILIHCEHFEIQYHAIGLITSFDIPLFIYPMQTTIHLTIDLIKRNERDETTKYVFEHIKFKFRNLLHGLVCIYISRVLSTFHEKWELLPESYALHRQ